MIFSTRVSGRFLCGAVLTLLMLSHSLSTAHAEPIGLIERYALAEDRQAVLDELIPGSVEFYYYHCLHYQVSGQLDLAEAKLQEWENDKQAQNSPLLVGIRDRQRLLTYGTSPDRTITYLRQRLGIRLDHAARPIRGQRQYPDTLPAELLKVDALIDEALRSDKQLTRQGLQRLGERFLNEQVAGLPVDLAWLLNQVDGPWMPRLEELVILQLQQRRQQDRRYGDLQAHNWLTLEELRAVAEAVPQVAATDAMVRETLLRLRADDDTDIGQLPAARHAYLERVDQYVSTLPATWNSLKASVLYRLLEADMAAGTPDRDRLMRYLKLPRNSPVILPALRNDVPSLANLNEDYTQLALLPPIGDETPLIRSYLELYLRDADDSDAFAGLIRADYLNDVFAETKLLAGIGPADRWYRLLTPAQQQQLKDRVELTLAPHNPPHSEPQADSQLIVDVKNVKELVVRIYEINTQAYYRSHTRPLNTDIDLDGLVATHQTRIEYDHPSVQRHRETIALTQLSGRGVWVVDLLGGGRRTRAMIRRGDLQYSMLPTIDGMQFTILDEHRQPVTDGRMLIGSQEFLADDGGAITIPLSDQALSRRAILMDDQLATSVDIHQPAESYTLQAAMLLNEQQLLPGRTAELAVRPRITLNGTPVSVSLLQEVALRITSTDLEGIQSTKRIDAFELHDTAEATAMFRVPARLRSLEVQLTGYVERLSDGRRADLSVSQSWDVNGANATTHTVDAFLTRDGDNWIVEARGKNGEAVASLPITLSLQSLVRNRAIEQTLQTNDAGQIRLGSLPGISLLRFGIAGGTMHQRDLVTDRATWPAQLHGVVGAPQRLAIESEEPAGEHATEPRFTLFELRGDRPLKDVSDQLQRVDGQLQFTPAVAGNFRLLDTHRNRQVSLAITAGQTHNGVAVGTIRQLQIRRRDSIGIASLQRDETGVHLQLSGDAAAAHVHVVASRYLPRRQALSQLALPSLEAPQSRFMQWLQNAYISDMKLGEEYEYVLRRQYAKKYPGVMLPQPSLLLNPWETEETQNESQSAMAGDAPMAAAQAPAPGMTRGGNAKHEADQAAPSSPSYDFLANGGGVAINLTADADGQVHIPAALLAEWPVVQIVVMDPATQIQRTLFGESSKLQTRDLRLTQALAAERPLAFDRGVLIASPTAPLQLADLGSAQLQVYATVRDLMTLYITLSPDGRLAQFRELGAWHTLSDDAKRETYGRLACHEVHAFLYMQDRPFFDAVVRPYLEFKKEKQLIDDWLLGRDLTPWTEPWRYAKLNAVERAVLARHVPAARESILRDLREQVALQKDDPDQLRRAIDSGLSRRGLEEKSAADFAVDGLMLQDERLAESESLALGAIAESRDRESQRQLSMGDKFFGGAMGGMGGGGERYLKRRSSHQAGKFFQQLDSTKQWAESQWDHVRTAAADASLIAVDAFWLDYAAGETDATLSQHLLSPTANRHAALAALALCGLPLQSGDVGLPENNDGPYAPEHAVAVITKRLISLEGVDGEASLLVGQRFERIDAAPPTDEDAEVQVAPDEFLTQTGYLGQIVITNPTPLPRTVDVFWQIPQGALPLAGSLATDSVTIRLEPFAVQRREYRFYFPAAGRFPHYPVCVSHDGQAVARGAERTFVVVQTPTKTDEKSWASIARDGSAQQIEQFLQTANLHQLNLQEVQHRLQDRAVYDVVVAALDSAKLWNADLQAYAFHHRDLAGMQKYLSQRDDLVQSAGPVLNSELLQIEPIERAFYEHLEYAPLVRARIHPLREQPEILNDKYLQQYRQFMQVLAHQTKPSTAQQLALCYYLLIQNRIEAALDRFQTVAEAPSEMQLQRDYLAAYLALHRGDLNTAGEIAQARAAHPVPRWRERFAELATHLQQFRDLNAGTELVSEKPSGQAVAPAAADLAIIDRQRRQADAAHQQPSIQLASEGRQIRITHRNTQQATVNLYGVDLELLFSKTPFVRDDLGRMATVRPSLRKTIRLSGDGTSVYEIDAQLAEQTLLVEVVSGPARSTTLYYGGSVATYVSESFGQLQVSDQRTRQPLAAAYVKVYSRSGNGEVKFYKDGYTDLRGRFDYASLSAPELDGVERFAILVLDPERGASVHDVAPPIR